MKAPDEMGKSDDPLFGNIPPTTQSSWYSTYRNVKTYAGRGTKNPTSTIVADPEPKGGMPPAPINPDDEGHEASRKSR
jgi:Mn-containing catalase